MNFCYLCLFMDINTLALKCDIVGKEDNYLSNRKRFRVCIA